MGYRWPWQCWFSEGCLAHSIIRSNMYKKYIIFLFFVVVLPALIYSKPFLELNSGFGINSMGEYNSTVDTTNKTYDDEGYLSHLQKLSSSGIAELNGGFTANTNWGLFGFYLRDSALINYGDGGKVTWPDGTIEQTMKRNFSTFSSGLGVRRYLMSADNSTLNCYIGIDAGVYYFFNGSTNRSVYFHDSSLAYTVAETWSTLFPGGDGEAGLDWRITDIIGLNLRAGYRLGIGGVTVHSSSADPDYNMQYKRNVDYSGFYVIAGTTLVFGAGDNSMPRLEYKASEGRPYSEIIAQFYNDGVRFFESGSYDEAGKKFSDAQKLDPDNSQISEYLRRISILTGGNNAGSVEKKLETADNLRVAGNITEALTAYKDVLGIDPQNKQAIFYLDDFAKKAAQFRAAAGDEFAKGKLKRAVKDISKAAEYAPDDADITALKDKISGKISGKKEVDTLFNAGVDSYQKGDYGKAMELWAKALTITPDDSEIKKDLKMAKEKLAQEGKTEETDVIKIYGEAKEFFDEGMLEDARNKCELILRLDKGNTEAAEMIQKMDEIESASQDKDTLKKR